MRRPAHGASRRWAEDLNMPGFRQVIRCSQCGNPVSTEIAADSRCPPLRHRHARVLAMRNGRPGKPLRVHGNHYHRARRSKKYAEHVHAVAPRTTVERETTAPRTDDARKAFDDLFKFVVDGASLGTGIDRPSARISRKSQEAPGHTAVLHPNDWCAGDGADDWKQILDEVAALSDRVSIEEVNFILERDRAAAMGITAVPAIAVLKGDVDTRIRFLGAPAGYEFMSLIEAIILAGGKDSGLSHESKTLIAEHVAEPLDIKVFVTPTCPHCPRAVTLAHRMAFEHPLIHATSIEATEFMDLSRQYPRDGVPKTVVNGTIESSARCPRRRSCARCFSSRRMRATPTARKPPQPESRPARRQSRLQSRFQRKSVCYAAEGYGGDAAPLEGCACGLLATVEGPHRQGAGSSRRNQPFRLSLPPRRPVPPTAHGAGRFAPASSAKTQRGFATRITKTVFRVSPWPDTGVLTPSARPG